MPDPIPDLTATEWDQVYEIVSKRLNNLPNVAGAYWWVTQSLKRDMGFTAFKKLLCAERKRNPRWSANLNAAAASASPPDALRRPDLRDYWFADLYTLELIFMDQLIAVLPFQVDIKEIEQEGQMAFDTQSNIQNQQKDLQTVLDKTQSNPVPSFEEAMAGINSLIGLQTVKDKINEMYEYLSFIKIRQEKVKKQLESIGILE
jgi:hypothetical protein